MFWALASRRGYRLLREGRWDSALAVFTGLCTRFPHRADPFYEVGKLKFKKGDLPAAQQFLQAALDRSPRPDVIRGVLELTNWWMISSPSFFNSNPRFSPDGRHVAFCSARQDTNGDGKIDANDRAGIYIGDLSSGAVREVVSNAFHNASPVWSPDGRWLAYFSSRPPAQGMPFTEDPKVQNLYLRDLESQQDLLLMPASLGPRYPVFTPDGLNLVVCTIETTGGPSGLSIVRLDSQTRKPLTTHGREHTYPQISPDGKSLLFVSWRDSEPNPGIYLINLDTGKERLLISGQYSNAYPRFSPEGDSVLYLSRRRDTNGDGKIDSLDNFGIYSTRLSDLRERPVSSDRHYNKFPAWSSDGRWVVFLGHWTLRRKKTAWQGEDYFEFKGIYRTSASGGTPEAIVSDKFFGSRFCEVSPRGSLVAYVSWRPTSNRGLYIADFLKLPSIDQLRGFIQNNLS